MSEPPGPLGYTPRIVDHRLKRLLAGGAGAVVIEGAKGVGKTATALQLAVTAYRLEDPEERELVLAQPRRILDGRPPVLIDEWQRVPETWDMVRRAVDDRAPSCPFVLTGSASRTDLGSHTGAARFVTTRMRPMSLAERWRGDAAVSLVDLLTGSRADIGGDTVRDLDDYVAELERSGFPGIRSTSPEVRDALLDGYIDRIVDRDLPENGQHIRRPQTLRRWLTAYGAATSTTASYEVIRDASTSGEGDKPAKTTTIPYRDALERLWVLDPVPAWIPSRNEIARLSTPAKHHLVDPALAMRMLGVDSAALLEPRLPPGPPIPRDGTLLGHLFESLVTQSIRVYAEAAGARIGHCRTRGGDYEIDLIAERADHRVVAFEVKLVSSPTDADVRSLLWLRDRIGDDLLDAVVITAGRFAYRRKDGVAVIPAALLGP